MVSWTKGTFIVIAIVHALIIIYGLKPAVLLCRDYFVYFLSEISYQLLLFYVLLLDITLLSMPLIWFEKDEEKNNFVKEM